jgi:hypothetical protein
MLEGSPLPKTVVKWVEKLAQSIKHSRCLQGVPEVKVVMDEWLLQEFLTEPLLGAYSALILNLLSSTSSCSSDTITLEVVVNNVKNTNLSMILLGQGVSEVKVVTDEWLLQEFLTDPPLGAYSALIQ